MAEIPRTVGRHSTACASLSGAHQHVPLSCCGLVPATKGYGFQALRR